MIEVWCDGACEPKNPGGWGGYGAVIRRDGKTIQEISGLIQRAPEVSNNVAEYRALMEALEWLAANGLAGEAIVVRGDSKLVIEQMFGTWKIKGGFYAPLARQCKVLVGRFPRIRGQWVPREQNGLADELSKRELLRAGVKFRIQPEEALGAIGPAGDRPRPVSPGRPPRQVRARAAPKAKKSSTKIRDLDPSQRARDLARLSDIKRRQKAWTPKKKRRST